LVRRGVRGERRRDAVLEADEDHRVCGLQRRERPGARRPQGGAGAGAPAPPAKPPGHAPVRGGRGGAADADPPGAAVVGPRSADARPPARPDRPAQGPGPGAGADYLDRLEQDLRAAGIPVLNLTPLISAEAARDLRHDRYLYWLDDIHWNARGIALAAGAIRERWPLADAPCSTTLSRAVEKP